MAAFTFSQPQPRLFRDSAFARIIKSAFTSMIQAREARARAEVAEYLAFTNTREDDPQRLPEKRDRYDIDAAIVGKNGIYAWPY
ncbi:MAG: hypothetical protein AAF739_15135 [Pseudomonadota bacterium]